MLPRKPRARSFKKLVQGHTERKVKDLGLGPSRTGFQNLWAFLSSIRKG